MGKTYNEGGRPDRPRRGLGPFVGWDAEEGGHALTKLPARRRRADRAAVAEDLDPGGPEPFGPEPDHYWAEWQAEWQAEAYAQVAHLRAADRAWAEYDDAWAPAMRGPAPAARLRSPLAVRALRPTRSGRSGCSPNRPTEATVGATPDPGALARSEAGCSLQAVLPSYACCVCKAVVRSRPAAVCGRA